MGFFHLAAIARLSDISTHPLAEVNTDIKFGVSDLKTLVESFPPYWASAASYIYQKFGDPKNPAHAVYQHDR